MLVVLRVFFVLFVLIRVCSLLMKVMILVVCSFLIIWCRCFLNLSWYLVFVIMLLRFRLMSCILCSEGGVCCLWMVSVSFFIIVVLFMLGLLISIGLFLVCWVRIWVMCWIFFEWLIIGLSLFLWVYFVRLCLYLLRKGVGIGLVVLLFLLLFLVRMC